MSGLGPKLIQAVKEAIAGDFARVTVEGVTWVRKEELDRLRNDAETLRAQLHGMQDGSLVRDQAALVHRLRAENSELRRVLEDCANDLACHIEHHYRDTLDYPSQKRKYDLDMASVHEARAILASSAEQNHGEGG